MNELDILEAACCIAGLDRDVVEAERSLIERLAERAGVGRMSRDAMIEKAATDPDYYERQLGLFQGNVEEAMTVLFRVATADGRLATDERVVLRHFADRLGLGGDRFERLLAAAEREVESPQGGAAPPRSAGPGGFTIIELLVVVSIIALLVGILLPAIGRARDQAKLTISAYGVNVSGYDQAATSVHVLTTGGIRGRDVTAD